MKIVMLGFTGAGKTTYMASLYGAMQRELKGFSLRANEHETRKQLLNLSDEILLGKYPPPTAIRDEYEFYLKFQGQDVLPFTWSDYRGGALREKQENAQARKLVEDLQEADGIMMLCDSSSLATRNLRSNQLGRMITLVTQSLQNRERPVSVGIILTKFDLLTNFSEEMLNPFMGVVEAIENSDLVFGAIIPIACGRQILNVQLPLLFALHIEVIYQAAFQKFSLEHYMEDAQKWAKKSEGVWGGLRWAFDKVTGNPTDEEIAYIQLAKAFSNHEKLQELIEPVQGFSEAIQNLPLIDKGTNQMEYCHQINQIFHNSSNFGGLSHSHHSVSNPFNAF